MKLETLEDFAAGTDAGNLPPVHDWNPPNCGDIGMEIRHDGSWWHAGGEIKREKIIRLFSRILRKDSDGLYLVTPYEKVIIHVETTPFLAVDYQIRDRGTAQQCLLFRTNMDEIVTAGAEQKLALDVGVQLPYPTLDVRHGLLARLTRSCYMALIDDILAMPAYADGSTLELKVLSDGTEFIMRG